MPGPITVEKITLAGFRAYLNEQTFTLAQGKSLAIFAPNAKGKSSLVDGVEFFLSADGSLKRLGVRRSALQAGRDALPHIRATEKGIVSRVTMSFRGPDGSFGDARVVDPVAGMPSSAQQITQSVKLDFIIRGNQLRRFVEEQSPTERYAEVSAWFGLSPLVAVQENLRATRLGVNQALESNAAVNERLVDLKRITSNSVLAWDEQKVIEWINASVIAPLDSKLKLKSLDVEDAVYKEVKGRKEQEDVEAGLAQYRQALTALKKVYVKNDQGKESGAIPDLEEQLETLGAAGLKEAAERAQSASSVFRDVWAAASEILKDATLPLDSCPVCETPFTSTKSSSREKLSLHVTTQLASLVAYQAASEALETARRGFLQKIGLARSALSSLTTALKAINLEGRYPAIESYAETLESWQDAQKIPDTKALKAAALTALSILELVIEEKEQRQGDHTWRNALTKIDDLIGIKVRLEHVERVKAELRKLHDALAGYETFIASRIRAYCQKVIDSLRDRVNALFKAIHPEEDLAPAVRLELDPENKRPELLLSFDFAENRKGVAPSGYLSDAQVHTLALSLRLAAIEMFNKDVPVVVLDDVITSYDADHRRAFAGTLAEQFSAHQVIIVTHDERFYQYLKDQLPPNRWDFKFITKLDPAFGPKFNDHKIADKVIDDLHADGKSAANEMRQAEEDWLTQICREIGTDVRIREIHRPYSYERSELAQSLASFLNSRGLIPPSVPGVKNQFLNTLVSGQIENFGSHFQDNPNGTGSVGDEIVRWKEFRAFRDAFRCPGCNGKRFKRPGTLKRPVCNKDNCQTTLSFAAPPQAVTVVTGASG